MVMPYEENKMLEVCKFILEGLDTPEACLSEWWKEVVRFKLIEVVGEVEDLYKKIEEGGLR